MAVINTDDGGGIVPEQQPPPPVSQPEWSPYNPPEMPVAPQPVVEPIALPDEVVADIVPPQEPIITPATPPGGHEVTLDIPPVAPTPPATPAFGTPEYTEWYYNTPGSPGYMAGSTSTVKVDQGIVNVVNTQTGQSVQTGVITPPPAPMAITIAAPTVAPNLIVIGVSTTSGEVLVRDKATGNTYWKPGTADQIKAVDTALKQSPDSNLPEIAYVPPKGVSLDQPIPGQLASENPFESVDKKWASFITNVDGKLKFNGTTEQWNEFNRDVDAAKSAKVKVYTFRGDTVSVSMSELQSVSTLKGEDQYNRYVDLGILPEGEFIPSPDGKWTYRAQWKADEIKKFEEQLKTMPQGLQDAYKKGGIEGYNAALKDYPQTVEIETSKLPDIPALPDLPKTLPRPAMTTLGDGQVVDTKAFYDLDLKYQDIGLEQGLDAMIAAIKADTVELAGGGSMSKVAYDSMPKEYQDFAQANGFDALVDKIESEKEQFAKDNHVLKDGRGIPNDQWQRLDPYLQKIAETDGFDAMVAEQKRIQGIEQQGYEDAMSRLRAAGVVDENGNIDVATYLRKNPDDKAAIYGVFTDDPERTRLMIQDAENYNARPIALRTFEQQWYADNIDKTRALGLEVTKEGYPIMPDMNDPQRDAKMAAYQSVIDQVANEYKDKYGQGAFYGSIFATPLSFVFSPARAIAPDVTAKEISGLEWAVGGAQLATLAAPGLMGLGRLGSLASAGITAGSTGLFATDIIVNRSNMSAGMLGLSTAGLVLPFVPEIAGAAKGAINRARPSVLTGQSIGLTADVGRVEVPKGMSDLAARQLIEDVEFLNLTGKVPANELRGLKGVPEVRDVSITHLPNGTTDVKLLSADGNVIGHVSGSQRVFADTVYHATPDTDAIVNQIKDKGYFEVDPLAGEKPALFTSPQGAQSFAFDIERGSPSPGLMAIRVLPDDIKPLPPSVRDSATYGEMRDKFTDLAKTGQLEPGIYPLYKGYRNTQGQVVMEYELVAAPGTKFYAANPKWYAKGDVPQTGTTSLLNYSGAGRQVKVGDTLPTYWLTTDAARAAGKGVPAVTDMYAAKIYGDLTTIRQHAPWNLRLRSDIPSGESVLSSGSPFRSAVKQLTLTPTPVDWSAGRVTGLISNPDGKVLLVRQLGQDRFDLPGGSMTRRLIKNESPESAVARELYEETGIKPGHLQHTDSFKGKFNASDTNTRDFHIFEGVTKEKPEVGAEIAEYVWWDGSSDLKYPVAEFAKDAIKRAGTNQAVADEIITRTVIQDAMERAKNKVLTTLKSERGSIGFDDIDNSPEYRQALQDELDNVAKSVHDDAFKAIKQADDEGYLPYSYKTTGKKLFDAPSESPFGDSDEPTFGADSPFKVFDSVDSSDIYNIETPKPVEAPKDLTSATVGDLQPITPYYDEPGLETVTRDEAARDVVEQSPLSDLPDKTMPVKETEKPVEPQPEELVEKPKLEPSTVVDLPKNEVVDTEPKGDSDYPFDFSPPSEKPSEPLPTEKPEELPPTDYLPPSEKLPEQPPTEKPSDYQPPTDNQPEYPHPPSPELPTLPPEKPPEEPTPSTDYSFFPPETVTPPEDIVKPPTEYPPEPEYPVPPEPEYPPPPTDYSLFPPEEPPPPTEPPPPSGEYPPPPEYPTPPPPDYPPPPTDYPPPPPPEYPPPPVYPPDYPPVFPPPPITPPPTHKGLAIPLPDAVKNKDGTLKRGIIEWRQGKGWQVLPPRDDGTYHTEDVIYLGQPLPGTYKFAVGKGSAYKTLQVIGGAPQEDADVDMGWATVHISARGGQMGMRFAGGKEAIEKRWATENAYERMSYDVDGDGIPEELVEKIPKVKRERVRELPSMADEYGLTEADYGIKPQTTQAVKPRTPNLTTMSPIERLQFQQRYYLGRRLRPVNLG